MHLEKMPWSELIGDDITEQFLSRPGAEAVEWRSLGIVLEYLKKKFGIQNNHPLFLRIDKEGGRQEVFQLLAEKMSEKFRMFSDEEIQKAMTTPPVSPYNSKEGNR